MNRKRCNNQLILYRLQHRGEYITDHSIVTLPMSLPKETSKRNKKNSNDTRKSAYMNYLQRISDNRKKKPCRNAIWLQVFQADHYISWVYIISLDRVATFLQQIARSSVLRVQRLFWRARQKKKIGEQLTNGYPKVFIRKQSLICILYIIVRSIRLRVWSISFSLCIPWSKNIYAYFTGYFTYTLKLVCGRRLCGWLCRWLSRCWKFWNRIAIKCSVRG